MVSTFKQTPNDSNIAYIHDIWERSPVLLVLYCNMRGGRYVSGINSCDIHQQYGLCYRPNHTCNAAMHYLYQDYLKNVRRIKCTKVWRALCKNLVIIKLHIYAQIYFPSIECVYFINQIVYFYQFNTHLWLWCGSLGGHWNLSVS